MPRNILEELKQIQAELKKPFPIAQYEFRKILESDRSLDIFALASGARSSK